jgi:hypothetical protein
MTERHHQQAAIAAGLNESGGLAKSVAARWHQAQAGRKGIESTI